MIFYLLFRKLKNTMKKLFASLVVVGAMLALFGQQAMAGSCGMMKRKCGMSSSSMNGTASPAMGASGSKMENMPMRGCPALSMIPETAEKAGNFTILLTALKSAGLDGALAGEGPFTVFAPTDAAFKAQFSDEQIQNLLKPENKAQLTKVLTYHVVPGRFTSREVVQVSGLKTLEGTTLPVMKNGTMVEVGQAGVVQVDVKARNGVIHAIDHVLMP
jgi:uncharacterized surface protein with fasciclin (FAS1) repeats